MRMPTLLLFGEGAGKRFCSATRYRPC